jgi:hypothetical protein
MVLATDVPVGVWEAMIASRIAHRNHEKHSYINNSSDSRRFAACEHFFSHIDRTFPTSVVVV